MALAGPQIGGVSLVLHTLVIIIFSVKSAVIKVKTILTNSYQKTFRPSRLDAR